ncbi:MAG: hypothetical protein KDE27_01560 [Planctomycetes bacterium]|nr:hypothetical protein [Planctomycetota bacterium]
MIGFLQICFNDPMVALGSQAPGCVRHTDVGVAIRAQGGGFVPGINPLGLIASNGLRGTIGNS